MAVLAACPGISSAIAIDSLVVDTAYSFNAIDHLLQRSAGMPHFEEKKFADRLFISVEGGLEYMRNTPDAYGSMEHGYRLGLLVGDWLTPVHGWRVGFNAGRHTGLYGNKPWFGGVSADYLMNLSALMRGEDYNRKFDVIGTLGAEAQLLRFRGEFSTAFGVRAGIQARWYMAPSTFLFVEPRLGVYSDNVDCGKTWHHYDWSAQILFGLGYRFTRSGVWSRSVDNSEFVNDRISDNLFAGVGAGVVSFVNDPTKLFNDVQDYYNGFAGKWFAAHSGVRLQFTAGKLKERKTTRWTATFDLDYIANLNSIMNGYDRNRKFETNLAVGISAMAVKKTSKRLYGGLHAGIQGVWNLTPQFGLYIEPQVRVMDSKMMFHRVHRFVLMPQVSMGVIYRSRPSHERDIEEVLRMERADFAAARHHYISAGGGVFGRTTSWTPAFMATMSYGGWITPQTGWRVNLGADNFKDSGSSYFHSIYGGADLMVSLSTLASGYDPKRFFDLRGFVGVTAGVARYKVREGMVRNKIFGGEAGLHAAFKISDNFELFVEPMAQLLKIPDYRHSVNPQWRVSAGVTYRMGRDAATGDEQDTETSNKRNFVFGGIGTGIFSETMFNGVVPLVGEIGAGRWITGEHGVQLSGKMLSTRMYRSLNVKVNAFTIDYLLNVSAMLNGGERSNHINIIGIAGAGFGWSNVSNSKTALAGKVGMQMRWTVAKDFDVTLTPAVTLLSNGTLNDEMNVHGKGATATLTAGVAYSF